MRKRSWLAAEEARPRSHHHTAQAWLADCRRNRHSASDSRSPLFTRRELRRRRELELTSSSPRAQGQVAREDGKGRRRQVAALDPCCWPQGPSSPALLPPCARPRRVRRADLLPPPPAPSSRRRSRARRARPRCPTTRTSRVSPARSRPTLAVPVGHRRHGVRSWSARTWSAWLTLFLRARRPLRGQAPQAAAPGRGRRPPRMSARGSEGAPRGGGRGGGGRARVLGVVLGCIVTASHRLGASVLLRELCASGAGERARREDDSLSLELLLLPLLLAVQLSDARARRSTEK